MLPLILRVVWGVASNAALKRGALAAQAKFAGSLTTEYVAAAAATSSRIATHIAKQLKNPLTLKNLSLAAGKEVSSTMVKGVAVELSAQIVAYLQTAPDAEIADVFDHLIDQNSSINSRKELFELLDIKMSDLSFTEALAQASTVIGVLLKARTDSGLANRWEMIKDGVTMLNGGYRLMKQGKAISLGHIKGGRVTYHDLNMIQRNPVLYSAMFAKKGSGNGVLDLMSTNSVEVPLMLRGQSPSTTKSNFFVKYAPLKSHLSPIRMSERETRQTGQMSDEKRVARTKNGYFPFLRLKDDLSNDTLSSVESRLVALRDSNDSDGVVPIRRSKP